MNPWGIIYNLALRIKFNIALYKIVYRLCSQIVDQLCLTFEKFEGNYADAIKMQNI